MPRMKDDPDFLGQVRSEVIDPRVWIDRAVVGLFALLAGLSVVVFTLLADAGEQIFKAVSGECPSSAGSYIFRSSIIIDTLRPPPA